MCGNRMTGFFSDAVLSGALHMWFAIGVICVAMALFATERFAMETTSMAILAALLLFYHFFPVRDASGANMLGAAGLMAGFSNTALLAVVNLLIVGQAVVQTGALNEISGFISRMFGKKPYIAVIVCFFIVAVTSSVLNNTPVVVIFIPILAALCNSMHMSASKVMIPLSYAAILGGMTTLLGSSTNLLVSGVLTKIGEPPLGFFDFVLPGAFLAGAGFLYVVIAAPRLLIDRASPVSELTDSGDNEERRFVVQIQVRYGSELIGKAIDDDFFEGRENVRIRMIQREEQAHIPPFNDTVYLRPGDTMILSAPRKSVSELLADYKESILPSMPYTGDKHDDDIDDLTSDVSIAEVVVPPGSRLVGQSLAQIGFHSRHKCVVIGIQRQQRFIKTQLSKLRLMQGDVLLVIGKRENITALQSANNDLILLEWSSEDLHSGNKAVPAAVILSGVVCVSATGLAPIVVSSFVGALACLMTGCLNFRQLTRAIDSQIVLIVAASLAMGAALQETGGAAEIAHGVIHLMQGAGPVVIMSVMFVVMALITNVLSNNASAVLFTPIAVNTAQELGAPVEMFIFAVIFACNCSFITPIGYQTNLLVMGPGHYKFSDYARAGAPLAVLIWLAYTAYAYIAYA